MASSNSESASLLPPTPFSAPPRARGPKSVTFNPDPTSATARPASPRVAQMRPASATQPTFPTRQMSQGQPMLSALNSKLRRRNSHGSPLTSPAMTPTTASKIGPQRTTKKMQKLKLLPNPELGDEEPDEESGRDVYSQFTRIKDPTARRDAARLGKADRDRLPRVTAYCTANSYRLDGLMRFLKGRGKTRGASPKQFDECIYSPFKYRESKSSRRKSSDASETGGEDNLNGSTSSTPNRDRRKSDSAIEIGEVTQSRREELIDLTTAEGETYPDTGESSMDPTPVAAERMERADPEILLPSDNPDMDISVHTPEVFLFEYGTVVIWGMTLEHEQRFLKDIARFETEKLSDDDVQTEDFNFYYTREYQARIYNDFISLREKRNYMTKLAISHALAQSVKTSLFEDIILTTITLNTPLPALLAETGSISLSRNAVNKKIGELFILRINIHMQGSVLDSPELMWAEPQLEPVYGAVRSYLEMDQRVGLLTERLDVLGDLLAVLREEVKSTHGEALEWIVIVLIAAEILVAAVNIVVDLYAGVD